MTRHENARSRRGRTQRAERQRVLIVCGGRVTEPRYFKGMKQHCRNTAVHVEEKGGKDPTRLVRYAASQRNVKEYDEVWCVTDVDEYDIEAAAAEAKSYHVKLAVSNPCFEYWLLLHFELCTAPLPYFQDVETRLKRCVPRYTKSTLDFTDYVHGVADAVSRAKQSCEDIAQAHRCNPSSGVWALVEQIAPALNVANS